MYVGECMLSIINMINGIWKRAHMYQIYNTSHILIFGEYVKVRKHLFTQIIIWIMTF